MLGDSKYKFCEMAILNRQSDGMMNFPFRFLREATESEVEEYINLEIESKPLLEACEMFTPVELNFKRLTDITDNESKGDYQDMSHGELEDRIVVQISNYILAFQVLIEHWKALVGQYLRNEEVLGRKVWDHYNYLRGSMSTWALIKALRNYLTHHARIPLRCGRRADVDTGKNDFLLWVSKSKLLSDSKLHADDRETIEEMPDFFDLLPIIKKSKEEVERFQLLMQKTALLSSKALTLRDKACDMQKRFGLENHWFFPVKSSEIFFVESKTHGISRPTFNLEFTQIPWGLILLTDAYDKAENDGC